MYNPEWLGEPPAWSRRLRRGFRRVFDAAVLVAAVVIATRALGWWGVEDALAEPQPAEADEVVGTFRNVSLHDVSSERDDEIRPAENGWVMAVPEHREAQLVEQIANARGTPYLTDYRPRTGFGLPAAALNGIDGLILSEVSNGLFSLRPVTDGWYRVCWIPDLSLVSDDAGFDVAGVLFQVEGCIWYELLAPDRLDLTNADFFHRARR